MPEAPLPGPEPPPAPPADCALCPRLAAYRTQNRLKHPAFHNAPVPSWGPVGAKLMVLGMAPGLKGANRTGRPFTGDHAGLLLYATLIKFGVARGTYAAEADDGLQLLGCRIVNAVRCAPPANLPEPAEVKACNTFLQGELRAMTGLRAVLALGALAHAAMLRACGLPVTRYRFAHGAMHELPDGLLLADSYHVSRYNTNTGRLTTPMFETVMTETLARIED
jgi:uracil-DNA glycosylase family 4